ncbi:MAG TPA: DUF2934 domain-containing protein [Steroidobacteraceae bacterium]|nr:DUF2934 domain-containing protein [Steroidobacteraceae bacterium]
MRSTQPGTAGKASDGLGAGAGSGTQLRSAAKTSSSSDEQMVRERAYALWEQAGRPDGRENEFWHRARQQLMTEGDHSRSSTSH